MPYRLGVRSRNLVLDGFNLLAGLRDLRGGSIRARGAELADFLTQPVRWLNGQERSDSFVSDDLRPALWECATLCGTVGQTLTRKRNPVNRRHNKLPRQDAVRAPVTTVAAPPLP